MRSPFASFFQPALDPARGRPPLFLVSRVPLRTLLVVVVTALAACDTPVDVSSGSGEPFGPLVPAHLSPNDVVVAEADGSFRPIAPGEEGFYLGSPGENRVALVVTGNARYGSGHVSRLRLNARQTAGGDLDGFVAATIFGQEVTDTLDCIRPLASFGRTFYGVNVTFAEPIVYTTPYGTVTYTHGAISVMDGGALSSLVFANDPGCRASALLYPYEPLTGGIQVIAPGA